MNDSMIDVFSIVYDRIHTVSLIFALFHSFPYRYEFILPTICLINIRHTD